MTETIILETTTKRNGRRINQESLNAFTEQAAYSFGYVVTIAWMIGTIIICVLTFSVRKWIFFYSGYSMTNDVFMQFWLVWGIASSTLAYFTGKHLKRIQMIGEYLAYMNSPTEITERQIQEDTAVMDYQEIPHNNLGLVARNRQSKNIGLLEFSGSLLQTFCEFIEKDDGSIRRDPTPGNPDRFAWRRDAPTEIQNQYSTYKDALVSKEYIGAGNAWTEKGERWLGYVDPPTESEDSE